MGEVLIALGFILIFLSPCAMAQLASGNRRNQRAGARGRPEVERRDLR